MVQQEKLRLKMANSVAEKHPLIETYCNKFGTRAIKDFNYISHSNGKMITLEIDREKLQAAKNLKSSTLLERFSALQNLKDGGTQKLVFNLN